MPGKVDLNPPHTLIEIYWNYLLNIYTILKCYIRVAALLSNGIGDVFGSLRLGKGSTRSCCLWKIV